MARILTIVIAGGLSLWLATGMPLWHHVLPAPTIARTSVPPHIDPSLSQADLEAIFLIIGSGASDPLLDSIHGSREEGVLINRREHPTPVWEHERAATKYDYVKFSQGQWQLAGGIFAWLEDHPPSTR